MGRVQSRDRESSKLDLAMRETGVEQRDREREKGGEKRRGRV